MLVFNRPRVRGGQETNQELRKKDQVRNPTEGGPQGVITQE